MDFCILGSTDKLIQYAPLARTHLVLAHITDPVYWELYKNLKKRGDFLILDNGAFEHRVDPQILRNLCATVEPHVCILPDLPGKPWEKTFIASKRFLDQYYDHFPNTRWMFVPQAERGDVVGWSQGLLEALDDKRISWIGLPRMLAYHYTEDPYIRVNTAQCLHERRPDITIHALGMVRGNLNELLQLELTHVVSSIDSHWPLKGRTHEEILDRLEACGVNTHSVRRGSTTQQPTVPGGEGGGKQGPVPA